MVTLNAMLFFVFYYCSLIHAFKKLLAKIKNTVHVFTLLPMVNVFERRHLPSLHVYF